MGQGEGGVGGWMRRVAGEGGSGVVVAQVVLIPPPPFAHTPSALRAPCISRLVLILVCIRLRSTSNRVGWWLTNGKMHNPPPAEPVGAELAATSCRTRGLQNHLAETWGTE